MNKYLFLAIFLILFEKTYGSVHHMHDGQKERVEDGSYSKRDHSHFDEDGVHNTEFDHEAIIGSAKEAQEFENLTPKESKSRLSILLKKMDRNQDKHIEKSELQLWILRSFRSLSKEESQERLEEVDKNGDGYVTWEEYISETYGITEPGDINNLSSKEKEDEKKMYDEDESLFSAADVDGDKRLSLNEFVAFSHPEEDPRMMPIVVQHTLNDKDENKDGTINFKEFVGLKGQSHDKEWLLSEKEKFEDFDSDKNGILDKGEIAAWIIPSNEDIAEDEATHLFGASDDDNDGLLSFDEVLDHYDSFVGSEATDYGEQLNNIHKLEDEL